MGILYAMMEPDLKRVLAYSTIENIGIIFVGLGLAIAFQANGLKLAAGAGDGGGTFPRSEPFLVQSRCSSGPAPCCTRRASADMDELGGLINRMPKTGFFFLVGALSISALPPSQRLRVGMAAVSSRLAGPGFPQAHPEVHVAGGLGAMLALAAGWPRPVSCKRVRRRLFSGGREARKRPKPMKCRSCKPPQWASSRHCA